MHDESEELIDNLENKLAAAEREIAALRGKLREKKVHLSHVCTHERRRHRICWMRMRCEDGCVFDRQISNFTLPTVVDEERESAQLLAALVKV